MTSFHPFGPDHLGALALTGAVCAWVVARGRTLADGTRTWVRLVLAGLLIGYAVAYYAVSLTTRGFRWNESLPLNVCDVVLVGVIAALMARSTFGFELAYFWGFAGTLQGMITPDLRSGFPTFRFFHFFWGHSGIVISLTWLLAVEGMRPRSGGVRRVFMALLTYSAVVGALDWLFGWNYGYLRHLPGHRSLLHLMGPHPWYLVWGAGVALVSFLLLDLPWRHARSIGKG